MFELTSWGKEEKEEKEENSKKPLDSLSKFVCWDTGRVSFPASRHLHQELSWQDCLSDSTWDCQDAPSQ